MALGRASVWDCGRGGWLEAAQHAVAVAYASHPCTRPMHQPAHAPCPRRTQAQCASQLPPGWRTARRSPPHSAQLQRRHSYQFEHARPHRRGFLPPRPLPPEPRPPLPQSPGPPRPQHTAPHTTHRTAQARVLSQHKFLLSTTLHDIVKRPQRTLGRLCRREQKAAVAVRMALTDGTQPSLTTPPG
jgi:hypothetical protein